MNEAQRPSRKYVIAADARLCRTSYVDDQSWSLQIGQHDEIAMALQSRYGKRASLVSLVPILHFEEQQIYQALTFEHPPAVALHAPNYICLDARPKQGIRLKAEYWVMTSNAVGMTFTITNESRAAIHLRLDLYAHVIVNGQEQLVKTYAPDRGQHALLLGKVGNLQPCVILDQGRVSASSSSRIGIDLRIKANASHSVRCIHVGLENWQSGYQHGQRWLDEDWPKHIHTIKQASASIPQIQTGNPAWDSVLHFAYLRATQAFLRPTGTLPHFTFVAARVPDEGYSPRKDGSDHPRAWSGQDAQLAYQLAPVVASIDPELAQGVLLNYTAVQQSQGHTDMRPGPAGQRTGFHCPPLIARAVWQVYTQTQNKDWLKKIFPALVRMTEYWFTRACDADQDGIPEWQDERQFGYVALPTFAPGQNWSQGASISYFESPSLIALLLSEIDHLHSISAELRQQKAISGLLDRQKQLVSALQMMWTGDHFAYRDRDSHVIHPGQELLANVQTDQIHTVSVKLTSPSRLVVRVIGGVNLVPQAKIIITGKTEHSEAIEEEIETKLFRWQGRHGTITTAQIYAEVEEIRAEGLSRVYRMSVNAIDTTRKDVNTLIPLISNALSKEQRQKMIRLSTVEAEFLRPSGITMVAASDPAFDPSNANGGGGVWPFWMGLVLEGLLKSKANRAAGQAFRRLLSTQSEVLNDTETFWQFYHSDYPIGSGERDHLGGIPPLYLFHQLIGVIVASPGRVWLHEDFAWGSTITLKQHGVIVRRTTRSIQISFPSGRRVELAEPIRTQWVRDHGEAGTPRFTLPDVPEPPSPPPPNDSSSTKRVKIDVRVEE